MPDAGRRIAGCQESVEAVHPGDSAARGRRYPKDQKLDRSAITTCRPGSGRKNPAFAVSA